MRHYKNIKKFTSWILLLGLFCLWILIIGLFSILFFVGCFSTQYNKNNNRQTAQGDPDKTSEYNYGALINQQIKRGENWRQIVKDSPFQFYTTRETKCYNDDNSYIETITVSYGDYPRIQGSTVCIPMGAEFARQHLKVTDQTALIFADFKTTEISYKLLINDIKISDSTTKGSIVSQNTIGNVVDLILVTEPSDDELSRAEKAGVSLVMEPICWDAFVFITHKNNPVNSLTVEQIKLIYSGEITNWSELGGKAHGIAAYQREQNSGSQTTMEKQVMKGLSMIPPPMAKVAVGMGRLIESVAEYENDLFSVGYTFKYYVDTLYKNDNIKILEVEGVSPSPENIRNGSYPFCTNYYAVYREEDRDGIAGQFTEWILSDEGQRCVEQAGYIPLK